MKKLLFVFVAVFVCCSALYIPVFAEGEEDAESGLYAAGDLGDIHWSIGTDGQLILSGNGVMGEFDEDSHENWHAYKDFVTAVTVEFGVENIGGFAFYGFEKLTRVVLPGSVGSVGNGAFGGCIALDVITVGADNQSYSTVDGALYDKSGKVLVCCPAGRVGSSYAVDEKVTEIAPYAFCGYTALRDVRLPQGLTEIGAHAFAGCTALGSVVMPDSVRTVGDGAFKGCVFLKDVTLPSSLDTLGAEAFCNCVELGSVSLSVGLERIEDAAFKNCASLTSVEISEGIESIGRSAFDNCEKLSVLSLPSSLDTVEYNAFRGCAGLERIVYAGTELEYGFIDIAAGNDSLAAASLEASASALPWIVGAAFILGFAAVLFAAVRREKTAQAGMDAN